MSGCYQLSDHSIYSFLLEFVLPLFCHVGESPASSARIVLLQGFELLIPSATLSVVENRSWHRRVTFHVRWWCSYCTHVRLVVVADTNRSGRN